MELYRDFGQIDPGVAPCALAIGSFDGLHLGHRLLVDRTRTLAASAGLQSAVLTFEPHPARALAPGFSPPLLMSYARKLRALDHLGLQRVLAQEFTPAFARLPPEEFVARVLVGGLRARIVVVGDDFTYGRDRLGQAQDLAVQGQAAGFEVEVVRRLAVEGMIASSTRIRSFLLQGRVRAAGLLLGRPYTIVGQVVRGAGRGRGLGFPTANLQTDAELLPARGVYVCHAFRSGWPCGRLAVTNIGTNPTFGPGPQTVEAHLLDYDEELTGQVLGLSFRERLRGEIAFSSAEELVDRIGQDVAAARGLATSYPEQPRLDLSTGIDLDRELASQG